jgi:hypothetical protein
MKDFKEAMGDVAGMMDRLTKVEAAVSSSNGSEQQAQDVVDELGINMDDMLLDPDALSATPEEAEELFQSAQARNAKKLADGLANYVTRQ